jgi:hypothetical protein
MASYNPFVALYRFVSGNYRSHRIAAGSAVVETSESKGIRVYYGATFMQAELCPVKR